MYSGELEVIAVLLHVDNLSLPAERFVGLDCSSENVARVGLDRNRDCPSGPRHNLDGAIERLTESLEDGGVTSFGMRQSVFFRNWQSITSVTTSKVE